MDGRSWPIDLIVDQLYAEFDRQDNSAVKWLSNPYCVDSQTGRNVARDELLPSAYMRRKTSKPHAEKHPADYIERVVAAAHVAENDFVANEQYPNGFRIGTFSELDVALNKLRSFSN